MRNNREYQICKDIAIYLRMQYPNVIFHFDLAGLNLSRAQAGMMKTIQGKRGWPDLFIAEHAYNKSNGVFYNGLVIEVKTEGTKLLKSRDTISYATPHIDEQAIMIQKLNQKGFYACFACGFDNVKSVIDWYLML